MSYKWIGPKPADEVVVELMELLGGDSLDRLREIVFFLYKGSPHDSLYFAMQNRLSGRMTIAGYHAIYGWTLDLCAKLLKEYKDGS